MPLGRNVKSSQPGRAVPRWASIVERSRPACAGKRAGGAARPDVGCKFASPVEVRYSRSPNLDRAPWGPGPASHPSDYSRPWPKVSAAGADPLCRSVTPCSAGALGAAMISSHEPSA